MCGVTFLDKIPSEELKTRKGLEKEIVEAMRQSRLGWYGHVMKKDKEGVKCMNMTVEGMSQRGVGRLG